MFLNRKYIYPIALFLLLLISCQQGDSDKLNIDSNIITGEVVPNDSLHPPIISNLREPVGKGYNNPKLIPRINNSKPIKPSQRFEIPLSASIQLSPGASNYPVSSNLTSKPTLMKSPWAGEVTRSKNTDGQALLLSEKDGLKFVTDVIVQGPESAIWGCSKWSGIWKYDGYQFFHFDKSTGLADPSVSNLFFDSDDDLWIGMSSGLAKFDGTHITHYTGENEASRNKPSRLTEDNNGNIWVGAKDGLSCINKKETRFVILLPNKA